MYDWIIQFNQKSNSHISDSPLAWSQDSIQQSHLSSLLAFPLYHTTQGDLTKHLAWPDTKNGVLGTLALTKRAT